MLWIENIVESTPPLPFLINSRVDMANFVDPYKVVVRRSAFSFFVQAHKMKVNWKAKPKKKLRIRMPIFFTSDRRFEFIRKS